MDDGDDRDRRGCLLGGKAFAGAGDDDDVHGSAHQIGDVTLDQLFAAAGEALVESDVGSVDIAQFAHLLEKAAKIAGIRCAGCDRNKAHDRSRSSLLRARRERPHRRAAEQRYKVPPPHAKHEAPSHGCRRRSYQLGTAIDAVGLPHLHPAGGMRSRSLGQT